MTGPASGSWRPKLPRPLGSVREGSPPGTSGSAATASPPSTPGPAETASSPGRLASLFSAGRLRALLIEHRIFVLVLIPAIGLRADAELGYRWQLWFNDSFTYMSDVIGFHADVTRPAGYSVFLMILEPLHSYALITILQHLMGVAVGVMVYALARHRFGAPVWVASLAAVPVLYDAFQIQLEHLILSDVLFEFLVMLAVTLVLWDKKPPWHRWALAGLLLGVSATVRSLGEPLLAIFIVYMIIHRIGWRAITGSIVACAVPVLLYCMWFFVDYHQFTLSMTESNGVFLYSRVMTFADCAKMHLPAEELSLCTTTPPAKRPIAQAYIWRNITPLDRFPPSKFSPLPNALAGNFAERAILAQPSAYLRTVADDTIRVFDWKRTVFPNAATYNEYLFRYRPMAIPKWAHGHIRGYSSDVAYYVRGNPVTDIVEPFAGIMRVYQRSIYLPGTLYGVILVLGLGGMVLAWRRVGGEALLPWAISVALIVAPAATAEFDYRYVLPAAPFACLAAAMALGKDTAARKWLAARRGRPALAAGSQDVSAGRGVSAGQELARGETTPS